VQGLKKHLLEMIAKMKTHKTFIGELLLAFVFTVSLLTATPASAIIGECVVPAQVTN
jgi:hypothetical protein